jgi:hypothetical protein
MTVTYALTRGLASRSSAGNLLSLLCFDEIRLLDQIDLVINASRTDIPAIGS